MTLCTTKEQVQDELLLPLFDLYESGKDKWLDPDPYHTITIQEFEPMREWLAESTANGWLEKYRGVPLYRLTAAGYKHFAPRVAVLRAIGKP